MPVYTRSSLRSGSTLPRGWRVIEARHPASQRVTKFWLSPEGKRFQSLMAAKSWLLSFSLESEQIASPRRQARPAQSQVRTSYRDNLPERVKQRRSAMTKSNPFTNLLQRILKRNYTRSYSIKKKSVNIIPKNLLMKTIVRQKDRPRPRQQG